VEKSALAVRTAQIKQKELEAVVNLAIAQKQVTREHYAALQAQKDAVKLAVDNMGATRVIAGYQAKTAQAVLGAAQATAKVNMETNSASQAADNLAGGMTRTAVAAERTAEAIAGAANSIVKLQATNGGLGGAAWGGAYNVDNPALQQKLREIWDRAMETSGSIAMQHAALAQARATIAEIIRRYQEAKYKRSVASGQNELWELGLTGFATGGYVSSPTAAMIGEGGESEYVIPSSKMGAAMANYAAGRRGDAVLNPQVNITTGPVTQMGGVNYVTQQDLMAATSSAAKQGAKLALGTLRSDPGVRRSVGLGG
jgi:hypothetical protein